jgi:hypothetical protein
MSTQTKMPLREAICIILNVAEEHVSSLTDSRVDYAEAWNEAHEIVKKYIEELKKEEN